MILHHKKTFTLIEMLIVIVIIGILAAALIPRLQSVQSRARDTKRKVDLTQIHNALMIHLTDTAKYPTANGATGSSYVFALGGTTPWIMTLSGYMTSMPVDPTNNTPNPFTSTGSYGYVYGGLFKNETTFYMDARLENANDPDRCAVKGYQMYIGGSTLACTNDSLCGGGIACGMMYQKSDLGQ